ncbi:MAG TPA: formate dehydrogenase subunit delta [Sphingomonas sp.]|nr:formate dehydrogenase subunit delta [Sphingomonas sp.]
MMSTQERLVYMANQIARNLAALGPDVAARTVADHIAAFWDPRMKTQLFAMTDPALDPIAARAVALLRGGDLTPAATRFAAATQKGGSDAG